MMQNHWFSNSCLQPVLNKFFHPPINPNFRRSIPPLIWGRGSCYELYIVHTIWNMTLRLDITDYCDS